MKINIPKNESVQSQATNYFFVTDLSGSMGSSIRTLKNTLSAVKDLLLPGDTLSLAYFSSFNDFDWIVKGASITNKDALDKLINEKVYARGLTCFNQVLGTLKQTSEDVSLITGNKNNVLYFLTDGYPNSHSPENELLNLCDSLKDSFVHKQIVGYSNYYNRPLLLQMAERIGGSFGHISDYMEMEKSYTTLVTAKKVVKLVSLEKCYDLIWQVTDKEVTPLTCKNNQVEVLETATGTELFAVDFDELNNLPSEHLSDAKFVYSLAFILSQKNKANLAVSLIRKVGDTFMAKLLQKSFTVNQKGRAENDLKSLAIKGGDLQTTAPLFTTPLADFLKNIRSNFGKIAINTAYSPYTSVSRGGKNVSKVEYKVNDSLAKITDIIGNEDRANINFQTVRNGNITGIIDEDLNARVNDYNQKIANGEIVGKKIVFPIPAPSFKNYAFVSNGDFNFETIAFEAGDAGYAIKPQESIDLFDENQKEITIQEFVNLNKTLINNKAHASVLRFYIKKYSPQKHQEDRRVMEYGAEGAKLLEEMGLDYAMRYSAKIEKELKNPDMDYIPFTEISTYIGGASTISASTSFGKYEKKGKKNAADEILWPLFDKYENLYTTLGQETFIQMCQTELDGLDDVVSLLSQKISSMKFYLMITNSWFTGIDKADEITYDGLVIKTKVVNEYL